MSTDLKPRPYCGAIPCTDDGETMGAVECMNRHCPVNPSITPDNEEGHSGLEIAIAAWNTRAPSPSLEGLRGLVEKWRRVAIAGVHDSSFQQGKREGLTDCADELEEALGQVAP